VTPRRRTFQQDRHLDFWAVSKNIYRFVPASLELILNYHTVNERIHIDAHMSTIQFFYKLMRNSVGWEAP
jgi:Gly-Xaa carboxypeptidase